MAKRKLELSAAEWEIMRVIWDGGKPVTVREVLDQAYPNSEKAYTTVQTLMNILVDKRFLKRKKVGMVNFYSAAVSQENVLRGSLTTLAGRMFQGSFGAMASFLVSSGKLSPEEVQALKKILDKQSGEKK
jgi:predicted transcriptional regulator